MRHLLGIATRDDSLVLRFDGTWRDVVAWACGELDAIVDVLLDGIATKVLVLPLEILGIDDDVPERRYAVRMRVVWEPPHARCARPDAWVFTAVGTGDVRDRILGDELARAKDAFLDAAPPIALGPIVLPHGLAS